MRQSFRIKSNIIEAMEGRISAYILAGGKSSRMGSEKGMVSLVGKPMISYLLNTLSTFGIPIAIISSNPAYKIFGYPVIADLVTEKGPMGGLHTVLSISKSEKNLVVSCDSPLIPKVVFEALLKQHSTQSVTVIHSLERIYPFPGLYSKKLLPEIEERIISGQLKMVQAIEQLSRHYLYLNYILDSDDLWKMANINTQEDLAAIEKKMTL